MGSVAKVRKKQSVIGGSAWYNVRERRRTSKVHEGWDKCFSLMPLKGGFFAHCLKGQTEEMLKDASHHSSTTDEAGASSSSLLWFQPSTGPLEPKEWSEGTNTGDIIYAMKSIHLSQMNNQTLIEELRNEVEVLKALDHAHIVRVLETFDHRAQLFVVMELCSGGDLYTRDPYTEEEAARICAAILSAVSFMHAHGVIHRDLKYENILFASDDLHAEVKLIDFGLSRQFSDQDHMTEGVGTIYTMAPEVLKLQYTKQADLWSIGVIAFMLMSSQMPFYGRKREDVLDRILKGKYSFKGRRWKRVSKQGKAFVDDLLVMDPDDRATAEEALMLSWLNRRHAATLHDPHAGQLEAIQKSIERYVSYPKMRRISLMVVAHRSTGSEIGFLRKAFQFYDTNKDGTLDVQKFTSALQYVNSEYSDDQCRAIFDAVNIDGSGRIRYTEFLAASMEAAGWITEVRLAEAFDRLDHDDTGFITKGNLRSLLGSEFPEAELVSIVNEAASDPALGISYRDFMCQWSDDKHEFDRRLQEHLDKGENGRPYEVLVRDGKDQGSEHLSALSEDDFGGDDPAEADSRANFVEGKALSERKKLDLTAPIPKTGLDHETVRKALFPKDSKGDSLHPVDEEPM